MSGFGFHTLALLVVIGMVGPLLTAIPKLAIPVIIGELAAGMVIGSATFNKPQRAKAASANEKIRVGVMGLSRGKSLVQTFASSPNAVVEYVCDCDSRRIASAASVA